MVKIILFDEDNATVEGNDLLLDVQMEITLFWESCLFCKSQFMGKPRKHKSTMEVLSIAMCTQTCCEFPQDPEGVWPADFSGQFTVWDRSAAAMFSQRLQGMAIWGCVHHLLLQGTEQYLTQPFPWEWRMPVSRKSCPWMPSNVPTGPYHCLRAHPQLISLNTFSNLI